MKQRQILEQAGAVVTVALYERVSGSKQEKEETIETQDIYLRRHCQGKGYRIYGNPYRDLAVPNWVPLREREAFRRLLADAEAGRFQAVLCHTFDRWSRHYELYHEGYRLLRRLGVQLLPLDVPLQFETPSDRFQARMMLGSKEYVMDEQLDLMWKGRHGLASERSGYPGGPVDYGYCLIPLPPKSSRYAIAPETAAIVRRWYEEVGREGRSCCQIARRLNDECLPVPSACRDGGYRSRGNRRVVRGLWRPQMIAKMLKKTVYKGYKHYGESRITVPPIVTEELWDLAQAGLARNKKASARNSQHEYLLAGKCWCAHCQRTLVGRMGIRRRDGTQEQRLYCPGRQEVVQGLREADCPVRSFYTTHLEAFVWERLVQHLSQHEATVARLAAAGGTEHERRADLERQRGRLDAKLQQALALRDALALGQNLQGWELDPTHARQLYLQTHDQIQEMERAVQHLLAQMDGSHQRESELKRVETHMEYWHERIHADLSPRTRRHAVCQFVERVDVWVDEGGVCAKVWWRFDPAEAQSGDTLIDAPTSRRGCNNYTFAEEPLCLAA